MDTAKVLIVDDDQIFRERLTQAFSQHGYRCQGVSSIEEALSIAAVFMPSHAVVDLRLSNESGLDIVDSLVASSVRVVMLTGYGSVSSALEAVRRGAANYLSKPVSFPELEIALFGPPLVPTGKNLAGEDIPSLTTVEWEHIQRVLRDCEGNITHAAKRLGLHRQALQRKLRSHPEG